MGRVEERASQQSDRTEQKAARAGQPDDRERKRKAGPLLPSSQTKGVRKGVSRERKGSEPQRVLGAWVGVSAIRSYLDKACGEKAGRLWEGDSPASSCTANKDAFNTPVIPVP